MSSVLSVSEAQAVGQEPKLDPSDPRVRKLVYSMYRDMLSSRNEQANEILKKEDPRNVKHDLGVTPILETIIRQGSHTSSGGGSSPATLQQSGASQQSNFGTPTMSSGKSGGENAGPPAALFGAMNKDKKPFTYTPGGIDLSEIRSPRMAKRIQMNAAAPGVTLPPQALNNNGPPYNLPPASIAAMQPQIQVSVLPPGGLNPNNMNRNNKPSDYCSQKKVNSSPVQNIPPPPPSVQNIPPPPPPPERFSIPPPPPQPCLINDNHQGAASDARSKSPNPDGPPLSLASFMKQHIKPRPDLEEGGQQDPKAESPQIYRYEEKPYFPPNHPQVRIQQQQSPKASQVSPTKYEEKIQPTSSPVQQNVQNHQQERPKTPQPSKPQSPKYTYQQQEVRSPQVPEQPRMQMQNTQENQPRMQIQNTQENQPKSTLPSRWNPKTNHVKAQGVSQNIGTLYIPPIEQRPSNTRQDSGNQSDSVEESDSDKERETSYTPQTPQLNKAPTPWMNSQTKFQGQQQGSPSATKTNTPWGQTRVIPITFAVSNDKAERKQPAEPQPQVSQPQQRRVIPVSFTATRPTNPGPTMNGGERIIPIQIETRPNTQSGSETAAQSNRTRVPQGHRSVTSPNSSGPYTTASANNASEQAIAGTYRFQGDESPSTDPTQSKSFRVIQKITDDDDDGSPVHKTAEPRFRGSNIPSKAFHTLPSNSGNKEQSTPSFQFPVEFIPTHNIPIQTSTANNNTPVPLPPTTAAQQYQFPVEYINTAGGTSKVVIPASQQKVAEPKMYMGKNIPSRSFKMLQQLTGEADALGLGSSVGADYASNSFNVPSSIPSPLLDNTSSLSCPKVFIENAVDENDTGENLDNSNNSEMQTHFLVVPDDFDPNECNWDPGSYWYFWWYCASNFWNGTEYVFPEDWVQNYSMYFQDPEQMSLPISIPSKAFKNLQRSFTPTNELCQGTAELQNESENISCLSKDLRLSSAGDIKKQRKVSLTKINETEESEIESENDQSEDNLESQKESESEFETERKSDKINLPKCDLSSSNDSVDVNSYCGALIEEPDTPSSESEDSSTLVGDDSRPNTAGAGFMIEEYFSDDSEYLAGNKKDRLSTIDELSENEKTLSNILNSIGNLKRDSVFDTADEDNNNDEMDSDSSSEDEPSTASVIENKSESTAADNLNKDKPDSSSSSSESEDEDVNDGDGDEVNDLTSAVTARLPLRLSFSKSKSYRDITTVLVGDSEIKEQITSFTQEMKNQGLEIDENEEANNDETTVSFTLNLTEPKRNVLEDTDADISEDGERNNKLQATEANQTEEIDFWSEIMKDESCTSSLEPESIAPAAGEAIAEQISVVEKVQKKEEEIDFWSILGENDNNNSSNDNLPESKEVNFWDTKETKEDKLNFWESHGTFEFAPEYHVETANPDSCELEETSNNTSDSDGNVVDCSTEHQNAIGEPNAEQIAFNIGPSANYPPNDFKAPEPSSPTGEVSDESSSKDSSGGTVIAREDKASDTELDTDAETNIEVNPNPESSLEVIDKVADEKEMLEVAIMREVPINVENGNESSCNCQVNVEKIAKAENLLLRIEKFLEETFLLGSQNDSGILTDMSRQMSDYETDNEGDGESLLKEKEAQAPITKSGSFSKTEKLLEKVESIVHSEEKVAAFFSSKTAAERKALDYQRAKTHSRLFELLQEEGGGKGDEDDLLEEEEDEVNKESDKNDIASHFSEQKTQTTNIQESNKSIPVSIQQQTTSQLQSTSSSYNNNSCSSTADQRSRLIPLPIKSSYLTTSLSIDSNSSQSSSSGILSPMSPVNRDQLLTEIINEFQQRHQQTISAHFRYKKRHMKKFPSKIFQILQEEFGHEFYDAFDFGDEFISPLPPTVPQLSQSGFLHSVQEESTNQSSKNKFEEREHQICLSNLSPAEVSDESSITNIYKFGYPSSGGDPKMKLGRDPRMPKTRKTN